MSDWCHAVIVIDLDGHSETVHCSQAEGHPEAHSAKIWWSSAEPVEWEYATTTGPRKAWDREDVPPEGDGWVRDVARGNNGWERFDYHEKSYWKRRRPC